eukprot:TRINITY_DN6608_c0_g2_i1.p1 TRINITY_DN6608_c0_g2~~TRINITY_DN6608_c0_g2_i1.p1  ORF type:complete len:318 (+),score=81.61 TRINITY_DN6608_c0_g2_i1:60-1013(+)
MIASSLPSSVRSASTVTPPALVTSGLSASSATPAPAVGESRSLAQPVFHVSLCLAIATLGSRSRKTARCAEPVTAAAAAAAAAKAAGGVIAGAKAAGGAAAAKAAGAAGGAKASAAAKGARLVASTTTAAGGTRRSGNDDDAEKDANFDPSNQIGVTAPLGYFDPLGFSKVGDKSGFKNLRSAELKHGRVAMMAAVGAVVQHYVKLPGFEKVPAGMGAVETPPGTYGFAVLFFLIGYVETNLWTDDTSKEPGNFGDPAGLGMYTDDMRLKELNNGRMAMVAAIGIIVANLVTGRDGVEQLNAFLNPTEILKDVSNPL